MTIGEAIEQLEFVKQEAYRRGNGAAYDAAQLGIEALKHYQEVRPLEVSKYYPLLPGETKD